MDETPWKQVNITYVGQDLLTREREAVAHLAGVFPFAEAEGLVDSWFFIRKGAWRVRYVLTTQPDGRNRENDPVHPLLTDNVTWTTDIYEPETHAFGGHDSMEAAHTLFHGDSRHILTYLDSTANDRQERSLVLCTALMQSAGLDFHEQGDVWARLAEQRAPLLNNLPDPETWESFTKGIHQLITGSARRDEVGNEWLTTFETAGQALRELRTKGKLTRGVRAVIALHVIFHWNRMGISGDTQAFLARAAKEAVFD